MTLHIDIQVPAASAWSNTIVHIRNANGIATDLSQQSGVCYFRTNYTTNTYYTLNVTTDVNGGITLSSNSVNTANIQPGYYVYDVVLYNGTDYWRAVEGTLTLTPQVTPPGNTALWQDNPPPAPPGEGGGTPANNAATAWIPNSQ